MRYFVPLEYIFEQATPAQVWVINHSCGRPSVDVYTTDIDGLSQKIIPAKVEYLSDSLLRITFSKPFSGIAKIVG